MPAARSPLLVRSRTCSRRRRRPPRALPPSSRPRTPTMPMASYSPSPRAAVASPARYSARCGLHTRQRARRRRGGTPSTCANRVYAARPLATWGSTTSGTISDSSNLLQPSPTVSNRLQPSPTVSNILQPSPHAFSRRLTPSRRCTCYMAALMQQLFMCPRLADGLLAADAANAGNNQSEMLRELQLLLASLRHSSSAAWSPHGFCAAFRVCSLWLEAESFTAESFTRPHRAVFASRAAQDFDGQPLHPLEQRDADEFLHELLQVRDLPIAPTFHGLLSPSHTPGPRRVAAAHRGGPRHDAPAPRLALRRRVRPAGLLDGPREGAFSNLLPPSPTFSSRLLTPSHRSTGRPPMARHTARSDRRPSAPFLWK